MPTNLDYKTLPRCTRNDIGPYRPLPFGRGSITGSCMGLSALLQVPTKLYEVLQESVRYLRHPTKLIVPY